MSARVIQVRPSRNPRWQREHGWEALEAEGVCPVYGRDNGWEWALEEGFLQHLWPSAGSEYCSIQAVSQAVAAIFAQSENSDSSSCSIRGISVLQLVFQKGGITESRRTCYSRSSAQHSRRPSYRSEDGDWIQNRSKCSD